MDDFTCPWIVSCLANFLEDRKNLLYSKEQVILSFLHLCNLNSPIRVLVLVNLTLESTSFTACISSSLRRSIQRESKIFDSCIHSSFYSRPVNSSTHASNLFSYALSLECAIYIY